MQKNRRFNAGKQFRRLPVYSFRVCRKIRELLPGKNATVPGGIMDAASPSREHGTALVPEPTQCRNTGMSNLPAEISGCRTTGRQRTYRTPDQVHREVQNTAIRVAGVKIFYSERPAVMPANTSRYAAGAGCRFILFRFRPLNKQLNWLPFPSILR